MKRIALSFLAGFLIPFCYLLIIGPLSQYIKNERLKHSFSVPVRWPILGYEYLFRPFPPHRMYLSETGVVLLTIFGNIFFYGLLTYLVMAWLKPKKRKIEPPPLPSNIY